MTYEQYWHDDVSVAKYYFEANEIKKEQENTKIWLQGAYFYEALTRVSPMLNAMKPQKAHPYLERPYPLSEAEARKRKEDEIQRKRSILFEKLKSQSNMKERIGDKDVRKEN